MEAVCLSRDNAEHVNTLCLLGTSVLPAGVPAALRFSAINDSGRFCDTVRCLTDIFASPLFQPANTMFGR